MVESLTAEKWNPSPKVKAATQFTTRMFSL